MGTFPIESFPKQEGGRTFSMAEDSIETVERRKLFRHSSLRRYDKAEVQSEVSGSDRILAECGFARQFSYPSSRYSLPRPDPSFGERKASPERSPYMSSVPALYLNKVVEVNVSSPSPNLDRTISHLSDATPLFSGSEVDSVQGSMPTQSQVQVNMLHHSFQYGSTLAHLAAFGILGDCSAGACERNWSAYSLIHTKIRNRLSTSQLEKLVYCRANLKLIRNLKKMGQPKQVLIRYGLTYFFGNVLQVMNDDTALYTELPANAVGSFFMGWVGVVLKKRISEFSEPLAIGLSTGLMGSITTFASWNQKMVALATTGNWVSALVGYLIGMEVAQMSLLVGIETAKLLIWIIQYYRSDSEMNIIITEPTKQTMNSCTPMISLVISVLASGFMWIAAVVLSIIDDDVQNRHILWIACVVAPPGVWVRWYLARFNGKGLISKLKWLPIGTLLANLLAVSLDSGLAALLLAVSSPLITVVIEGLQLGFLGCMSTVSTFVTEVFTMYIGSTHARAFLYILATLLPASILGISLYSIPVWVKGYV